MGVVEYINPELPAGIQCLKEMIGHAGWPQIDDVGKCIALFYARIKPQYKTSLFKTLSVESTLHIKHNINEYLNVGVIAGTIRYNITFYNHFSMTFMYEHVDQNP